VPVAVVDEHMHVLPYWFDPKRVQPGKPYGATLLHIDAHSDFAPPSHNGFHWPNDIENLRFETENDEFIIYSIRRGLIRRVVNVYPPWTHDTDAESSRWYGIGPYKGEGGSRGLLLERDTLRGEEAPITAAPAAAAGVSSEANPAMGDNAQEGYKQLGDALQSGYGDSLLSNYIVAPSLLGPFLIHLLSNYIVTCIRSRMHSLSNAGEPGKGTGGMQPLCPVGQAPVTKKG